MKPVQYTRKNHHMKNMQTGKIKHFKHINEAKRASRRIQMTEDGALGRGTVRRAK